MGTLSLVIVTSAPRKGASGSALVASWMPQVIARLTLLIAFLAGSLLACFVSALRCGEGKTGVMQRGPGVETWQDMKKWALAFSALFSGSPRSLRISATHGLAIFTDEPWCQERT